MESMRSPNAAQTPQRVRSARPVRLKVSVDQKQSIKQIKEFIRSCLEKDSSLDPTGAHIWPDRVHDSPASIGSFSSTSSSNTGKIRIFKRDIDSVLKKCFPSIDSTKFDIVSNEIFYYMQKQLNYNDTNQLTQNIINEMNGSLTQLTVNKLQHQLKLSDPNICLNLFALEAIDKSDLKGKSLTRAKDSFNDSLSSVAEYDNVKPDLKDELATSPKRISSNDSVISDITDDLQQVSSLLTQLVDCNKDHLATLDQSVLSIVINEMDISICSTGFFNPERLEDDTQRQCAIAFIALLKSDKLNLKKPAATLDDSCSLKSSTQFPNSKIHSSATDAVVSQTVVSHTKDIAVQTEDCNQADVSTTQGLAQSVFLTGVIGSAAFILSRYFNK